MDVTEDNFDFYAGDDSGFGSHEVSGAASRILHATVHSFIIRIRLSSNLS